ncbi:MAG: LegC family aminotransferase, partial [Sulfurimonas sp.]
MTQRCEKITNYIQQTFNTKEFIPLHEPKFNGNEKQYLNECIDSTFVSSVGRYVDELEKKFAELVGAKYAVATVNGTAALHAALTLADVQSNDEVITQALTFIATANAISYCGAAPIFLDVDQETMGLSPQSLQSFLEKNCRLEDGKCINNITNKQIKACVPMHTFGHPCKIDQLKQICEQWYIKLIEDSAESLGSYYKQQHTGTFGDMGVFSFNGNKIITSGGGGMIVTDNSELAKRAKHITTTAKVPHPYEFVHDEIGFNYRMPNLNAALLVAQLEQLQGFLDSKRVLAQEYKKFFQNIEEFEFIEQPQDAQSNYWLNGVICKTKELRDQFLQYSNEHGVMTRPIWKLLNELPLYAQMQCDSLQNSRFFADRV